MKFDLGLVLILVALTGGGFVTEKGSIETIPESLASRMRGLTWHEGCPVPMDSLRLLHIPYLGFDQQEHLGQLIVNAQVADDVLAIFADLRKVGFQIERMQTVDDFDGSDDRSMAANNTSGFNCRVNTTTGAGFSKHSYGLAIDINPLQNPYTKPQVDLTGKLLLPLPDGGTIPPKIEPNPGQGYLDRHQTKAGMILKNDSVYRAFIQRGWTWGGEFDGRTDYQHFEKWSLAQALGESRQMIRVLAADWVTSTASLQRLERSTSGDWIEVGKPVPVVIGRNGLGWGRGLNDELGTPDQPRKKEGDGKAPAGIFRLSSSFGYEAASINAKKFPFVQATETLNCVDDTNSEYYNLLVDEKAVRKTWTSAEIMKRSDELYRWGIFVNHNVSPNVPGDGSCIFIHIWKGPTQGTSGCTAMAEQDIQEILAWLDPTAHPLLVQFPADVYSTIRARIEGH